MATQPYLVVYRVTCDRQKVDGEDHHDHPTSADYPDDPRLYHGDNRASPLRGRQPFHYNAELLPDILMIVHRIHSCADYHKRVRDEFDFVEARNVPR